MIIHGSLAHIGSHICVDRFIAYLSDLLLDVHINQQTPRYPTGDTGTVDWVCVIHDCEYLANKPYLVGQAFWLAYRKFFNPLYAADPHSAAGMSLELHLPNGEQRRFTLDRTCREKNDFLHDIISVMRKVGQEECLSVSRRAQSVLYHDRFLAKA